MKKKVLDLTKAEGMTASEIGQYLDDREKKFAIAYVKCGNATQAAIEAGYKPGRNGASAGVQGCRLLKREAVKAYRMALIREELNAKDLSKDSILLKLNEIISRCMQKEPVLEWDPDTKEKVPSGEWTFDSRGAVKAIEAINRMMGFDAPAKHEVKTDGLDALISQFSDGERKF